MALTITLPDELARLAEEKIAAGHYPPPVDVVGAALFALGDEPDIDPVELKRLSDEGIASGDAGPLDVEDVKRRGRERLNRG